MKSSQLYRLFLLFIACMIVTALHADVPIESSPFGKLPDGREVTLYTLKGTEGFEVSVMDYGAVVVSILAPDREGKLGDVVMGLSNSGDYARSSAYFGCVVGRVANRIADAKFTLDGKTYTLAANNAPGGMPCSLHGGNVGFDGVMWTAARGEREGQPALILNYLSKEGEEGFPGNLKVRIVYSLTDDNGLRIDYEATTDAATLVNLTNHSYFNLKGEGEGDTLDHELMINASHFTPVNKGLIPTGEIRPVAGTPFDFTSPRRVGERIDLVNKQLSFGRGYDHNFVIDREGSDLELAATVYEPASGRLMEVLTTEPGLQFYSGNFLDGTIIGKSGKSYVHRSTLVLETQHFPDTPNKPDFPSITLRPDEVFRSSTVYRFSTR